jgi:hypothetical protein
MLDDYSAEEIQACVLVPMIRKFDTRRSFLYERSPMAI